MDNPISNPLRRQATWPFTIAQFINQPTVFSSEQEIWDLNKRIDRDFKERRNRERVAQADWKNRLCPKADPHGAPPHTLLGDR